MKNVKYFPAMWLPTRSITLVSRGNMMMLICVRYALITIGSGRLRKLMLRGELRLPLMEAGCGRLARTQAASLCRTVLGVW